MYMYLKHQIRFSFSWISSLMELVYFFFFIIISEATFEAGRYKNRMEIVILGLSLLYVVILNRYKFKINCNGGLLNFIQSHLKSKIGIDSSLNTWVITILHWIFDVSVIIGIHCWRHGGIGLKWKITIDSYLILEE